MSLAISHKKWCFCNKMSNMTGSDTLCGVDPVLIRKES